MKPRSRTMGLLLTVAVALGAISLSAGPSQVRKPDSKKPAGPKSVASKKTPAKVVSRKPPAGSQASVAPQASAKKGAATKTRVAAAKRTRPRLPRRDVWRPGAFGESALGDDATGEDSRVRQAAVEALGPLNGTVVVADPHTGRVLSMVNQRLALTGAEKPCSTIKLPVALAALNEGIVTRETPIRVRRRLTLTLTEALAVSNTEYFEALGRRIGFEKWVEYANQFGFGEKAGHEISGENQGSIPVEPPKFGGVGRMSSYGEQVAVTPLQLAAFVSAIGNGGTLFYLQYPRSPEASASFQPLVKRQLNVGHLLPDLREGMLAAVDHGTGRRAFVPFDHVSGKTGTCSNDGSHLGWFASFAGTEQAKLAVVVLLRGGSRINGPSAAEVAGRLYRSLYETQYFAARERTITPVAAAAFEAVPHSPNHR